jgi:hypothetical protein
MMMMDINRMMSSMIIHFLSHCKKTPTKKPQKLLAPGARPKRLFS